MESLTTTEKRVNIVSRVSSNPVDLGVIIVSWNVKDLLLENLQSLRKSMGSGSMRIIVVDNASSDGSTDALKDMDDVFVIANPDNRGFAKAVNQGIAISNARHVLLLNPDMCVSPEAISETIVYLDTQSNVGVLGGKLLQRDGTVLKSVRRFPDVWSQVAILLKAPHLFPGILDHYLATDFDYEKEQNAPSVRGSYFAISSEALKRVGRLDERYFIWFEEVDYCAEVLKAGLRIMYVPSIVAQDFVGKSFAQRKRYWKQVQFSRSMSQFFWKWQPGWRAALISIIRPFPIAVTWVADHLS